MQAGNGYFKPALYLLGGCSSFLGWNGITNCSGVNGPNRSCSHYMYVSRRLLNEHKHCRYVAHACRNAAVLPSAKTSLGTTCRWSTVLDERPYTHAYDSSILVAAATLTPQTRRFPYCTIAPPAAAPTPAESATAPHAKDPLAANTLPTMSGNSIGNRQQPSTWGSFTHTA
jgi:hypothetical protein